MAIEIIKKPVDWTTIYNDNWLQFKHSNSGTVATIEAGGIEVRLSPAISSGIYSYDVSQLVRHLIDLNEEELVVPPSYVMDQATEMAKISDINIKVYDKEDLSVPLDSLTIKLRYIAGAQQYYTNYRPIEDLSVLGSPYMTYFEGYPFWIDLITFKQNETNEPQLVTNELLIKNRRGTPQQILRTVNFNRTARIWVDKVASGWNIDNIMPLNRLENVIVISGENSTVKEIESGGDTFTELNTTEVTILKKRSCQGYYLKWLNSKGGYSTHLFERNRLNTSSSSSLGTVTSFNPQNINEEGYNTNSKNIGKVSDRVIEVEAKFDSRQIQDFYDLDNSPDVYLWTSTEPYKPGKWISISNTMRTTYRLGDRTGISSGSIAIPNNNIIR